MQIQLNQKILIDRENSAFFEILIQKISVGADEQDSHSTLPQGNRRPTDCERAMVGGFCNEIDNFQLSRSCPNWHLWFTPIFSLILIELLAQQKKWNVCITLRIIYFYTRALSLTTGENYYFELEARLNDFIRVITIRNLPFVL